MIKKHRHKTRAGRLLMSGHTCTVEFNEAFIPPSDFDKLRDLPGCPPLENFPNGIYILGVNQFSKTVGYFPESQLAKMEEIAKLEEASRKAMVEKEIAVAP